LTHEPKTIDGFKTGLVLNQPKQILVDDAFPVLNNAWVYLNTAIRREGYLILGQLSRTLTAVDLTMPGASPWSFNTFSNLASPITGEPNANLVIGSVIVNLTTNGEVLTDNGLGVLLNLAVNQSITGITNASFAVINFGAAPNASFQVTRQVYITGVTGWNINLKVLTITAVGATTITVNYDSTLDPAWSSGGTVYLYGGSVNYSNGNITAVFYQVETAATITFSYYPGLPSMGIFDRNVANGFKESIYFDTKYAYQLVQMSTSNAFQEFPGGPETWSWQDYTFPTPCNYWTSEENVPPNTNIPLFWVTNLPISPGGEPIRYTDGTTWTDFTPPIDVFDFMFQALILIPFHGMLIAFNTTEGTTINGAVNYAQRVRASASSGVVSVLDATAWLTTPGLGYFEDLTTNERIQAAWLIGLNNIIIQTDSQTWVLSYTGMNIAPFRIDLVDSQVGTYSLWGSANMGLYVEGIGNRLFQKASPNGVTSDDQKIINFVYQISRENNGLKRVYACRDFANRTVSYSYPSQQGMDFNVTYPNNRLIYNYDNHSWANFTDTFTSIGNFRSTFQITWEKATFPWNQGDIPWNFNEGETSLLSAGNQQGYIFLIDSGQSYSPSLTISNITVNVGTAATFTSPMYSLPTGSIVQISGIVGDFASVNGVVGAVQRISGDTDDFYLFQYDAARDMFRDPLIIEGSGTYIGGGQLTVRPNFNIQTKAFNNLKQGQSIHVSYFDAIVNVLNGSTVQLNVFPFLSTNDPVNQYPENQSFNGLSGNMISLGNPTSYDLDNINNRALINQRANMMAFEFTLSNATMAGSNYNLPFSLSSMTVWTRLAGRQLMPLGSG
jgi:hypothetical protein